MYMYLYVLYMKPLCTLSNYRITGIRSYHLRGAPSLEVVREKIIRLLRDRIVVGHDVQHDFKAIQYKHPRRLVRDTAFYMPLRRGTGLSANERQAVSLKKLAKCVLKQDIQTGAHSATEDATATMLLYRTVSTEWEREAEAHAKWELEARTKWEGS